MKERKLTVNLTWANIFSFILMIVVAVPTVILFKTIWTIDAPFFGSDAADVESGIMAMEYMLLLVAFFAGIFIHELIHGMTWAHYAKSGWKSISFGIIWKMLTPYCHCSEPLLVRPYIIGALMPLVVLGIIPWVIGMSIGNGLITTFGVVYISAASGDILVAWKLRHEKATSTVLDHPTEAGCIIYDQD